MIDASAVGAEAPAQERSWGSSDCLLYAVAAGAGTDELQFTTENSIGVRQRVLPTFAATVETAERVVRSAIDLDWTRIVHGEQELEFTGELPVEATVRTTPRIAGVYDKGSGALIVVEATSIDVDSGRALFTNRSAVFVQGAGGFGGDRGPATPKVAIPDRAADATLTFPTRPEQALLYRLTGDRHPLHSDPEFARRAGFPRPILHGLCTYAIAGRALLHVLCDGDPSRLRSMKARFSSPVYPGDDVTVTVWRTAPGAAVFRAAVGTTVVLDNGAATYEEAT